MPKTQVLQEKEMSQSLTNKGVKTKLHDMLMLQILSLINLNILVQFLTLSWYFTFPLPNKNNHFITKVLRKASITLENGEITEQTIYLTDVSSFLST